MHVHHRLLAGFGQGGALSVGTQAKNAGSSGGSDTRKPRRDAPGASTVNST
jgi:hypothetical protein